jgi:hypothetical protein
MNPSIPLVMRIVILFDWKTEYFLCLIRPKNSHPKSIGGQIILNSHWLLKDEEAIDWREGFRSLKRSRGTSSRKVKEAYQGGGVSCVEKKRKEKNECVRKKLVLMCVERCCSWKVCVQELSMEGIPWQSLWSFVSNSCSSQIHRWIYVKLKTVLV